jgi:2-C-methyl-D-erythritol 4-phosphate cytidylyltransferase
VTAWAIVVAAGAGERLGGDRPKAFVDLAGRPLFTVALDALAAHPAIAAVVCVVPEGWEDEARAGLAAAGRVEVGVVTGGASRAESVARGLAAVPAGVAHVLVHDAARPLLAPALIDAVLDALLADADGVAGVVPALPLTDTVKRVDAAGRVVATLPRGELRRVQTPQGFAAAALRDAVDRAGDRLPEATDCAALVEATGRPVRCVAGDPANVKVTTPEDLRRVAEALTGAR